MTKQVKRTTKQLTASSTVKFEEKENARTNLNNDLLYLKSN